MIARRRGENDPIVGEFDAAAEQALQLSTLIRRGGDYPLLGKGDINLYSLFVERSLSLVKPTGVVGLLTPSGIYADHTAADFFRSISTTGRLGGIYDFENRRSSNPDAATAKWFADVDSRSSTSAPSSLGESVGSSSTRSAASSCAGMPISMMTTTFFHSPPTTSRASIRIPARRRSCGAAATLSIVSRIYRDHPVLVDRSAGEERKLWSVRYHRMFDMTNDSELFETADQLETAGVYRVAGDRYKRGDDRCAALAYQGAMIHAFDHRFASVGYNPASVKNPYYGDPVTDRGATCRSVVDSPQALVAG